MSRRVFRELKSVTRESLVETVTVMCDGCEGEIDQEAIDEFFANELLIYLNPDECVNQKFRRDYCAVCLGPIWEGICRLIGADPDDISGSDFEEEE
jgi:hypothetical protein